MQEREADVNWRLCLAVDQNDYDETRRILQWNSTADVHYWNDYSLRMAAKNGFIEIATLLIVSYKANISANDNQALIYAVENNHSDIVKLLLKYGADPSIYENYPLRYATEKKYDSIVGILSSYS